MPAGSEPPPVRLPHTFRPLGVRLAIFALGGMLLLVCVVVWLAFPPHIRAEFSAIDRVTAIALGIGAAAVGYALVRSRVVAREDGVTVVNGYKSRRYDWNEIIAIHLRPGNPWAVFDLSDGTSVSAVGIQGSDGSRAITQVRQIRALVAQLSRTERDD
jgi:hypothetical protein